MSYPNKGRNGYNIKRNDHFRDSSFRKDEQSEQASQFISNSTRLETITLQDLEGNEANLSSINDMRGSQQKRLKRAGVEELFPVQKVCFNLFVEGREIIVK